MASGWFKTLQCKSTALNDVVPGHHRRGPTRRSSSCKNTAPKDILEPTSKPKNPPFKRPTSRKPETAPITRSRSADDAFFPSLAELPQGHPSRNVVEIIFHTSWGQKTFPGRVEMVFKIMNPARTAARFEEYRDFVRSAVEDNARCVADGNEVMRFYCLGAASGDGAYEAGCGAWDMYVGKGACACTYSESGRAHEKAGGGKGRRAMLVCRVIAGRVRKREALAENRVGYDSVTEDSGELLVFDSRALLPCFLIIYIL